MKKYFYNTVLIFTFSLIFIISMYSSSTASSIIIKNSEMVYSIGKNLDILEDKEGKLSFEEASSESFSAKYIPSVKDIPNYGFSSSAYWIRFNVTFPQKRIQEKQDWFIKCNWPNLQSIIAYIPEPGNYYRKSENGVIIPIESRDIPEKSFLFRMKELPSQTVTIYIRVRSDSAVVIPLSIISNKKHYQEIHIEYIFIGAFFGIMIMMLVFHLLLYVTVFDKHFLYLIYYMLSQVILQISTKENIVLYFGIKDERVIAVILAFFITSSIILSTLFLKYILNLKKDLPAAAKVINLILYAFGVLIFLSFVLPLKLFWPLFLIFALFSLIISATISVIRLIQGYNIARYFIIIMALNIISKATISFIRFDLVPLNWFTQHLFPIASLTTALILSFAISLRMRTLEKDRIKAQELLIDSLEKNERMKDEFLANTSHELKTPLHGIVGLSELILKNKKKTSMEYIRENLSLISASGRRLISLVNDILDFSSIKEGGLLLNCKPVDSRDSVSLVASLLSPLIKEKAVEIRNSIHKNFPLVYADEERFKQIVTNLIGNAIKFTPFGVIEISAKLVQKNNSVEDDMVEISVSDTGAGIKSEDLTRIFNSFEQGKGSISRSHEGTGLGLAITKKLIELHGGTIWVKSKPEKGSTFFFTLPTTHSDNTSTKNDSVLNRENHVEMTKQISKANPEILPLIDSEKRDKTKPSLLIADDDPVSVKILYDHLSAYSYNVFCAPDGYKTLEKLKSMPIDLLLLDVMMPGLSGYDVLKKIRENFTPEELPVILITARSQIDDINRGFKAGANDYIIKPFSIEEISYRVENMLKLRNILVPDIPGLTIKEKCTNIFIPYLDIIYLSSYGKKSIVHTTGKDIEINMLIKNLGIKLPKTFIRIHKQTIINTKFLERIIHIKSGHYEAILNDADDTRLNISRTNISLLREYMQNKKGKSSNKKEI